MTYEIYRNIFMIALILSIVLAAVSVILFFSLRIPKVIGDLSGKTAKKAISRIREENEKTGDKAYKSSRVNIERGKLTDKISLSGRITPNDMTSGLAMATEKIDTQILEAMSEGSSETTVLNEYSAETAVLNSGMSNETTLLSPNLKTENIFVVEYDITYIHTNEVIT